MIVYLARDIPAFVMHCVYGESRSSLLIESTDSMMTTVQRPKILNFMSLMLPRHFTNVNWIEFPVVAFV